MGKGVAQELKISIFFTNINAADYIEYMKHLKWDAELCVDHITKPFTGNSSLKVKEVYLFSELQYVYLDFNKTRGNRIALDDIVYLCADKQAGSESNNKQIYFINRSPENLIDFSFSRMQEKGFPKSHFITIHKSFRVNRKYIKCYHKKTETVEVFLYDDRGKIKSHHLPVSENYQSEIRRFLG